MNIISKKVPLLVALFVALSGCGTLIEAGEEAATCVFDEDCGANILLEVLAAEEVQCGSNKCVKLDVRIQNFNEETVDIPKQRWSAGSQGGMPQSATSYGGPATITPNAVKEFGVTFLADAQAYTLVRILQEDGEILTVAEIPVY
jgi:hypothetical protein